MLPFGGQKLQDGTEGPGSASPWERSAIRASEPTYGGFVWFLV